jgi:hypothetical protein
MNHSRILLSPRLIAAWTLLFGFRLQAALIAHEPFQYPPTNRLTALNGGLGRRTPWAGQGSIVPGSPGADRVGSSGNSLFTPGNDSAIFRTLGTNGWDHLLTPQRKLGRDGTTLWLGFVLRRDARPSGNRYLGLSLFDDSAERLFVGVPFNADVWGIEVSSVGSAVRSSLGVENGTPALLVVRLRFGDQGAQDTFSLFVNPTPGEIPSTPDAETINYNQSPGGAAGSFGPDRPIPGVPTAGGNTDNIALESIAFVDLHAGHHRWGIHSDDGFRLTLGVNDNPRDRTARIVGIVDGGLAGQDTLFDFFVERQGIYAVRLVWFESSGGAHVEWFSVDPDTGERLLINDRTQPPAVRAYRRLTATSATPYASRIEPLPDVTGVPPDSRILVELTDLGTSVNSASVRLVLNGTAVSAEVEKTGARTQITYRHPELFAPGSRQRVGLTFTDDTTPPVSKEVTWEFAVENYPVLPASMALASGSENTSQPGFRVRTVQASVPVGPTRLERAESQLAYRIVDPNTGEPYPNVADTTGADSEGFVPIETTLNFNQDRASGQEGHFVPDRLVPGIPGVTGNTQNFAVEVLTYLELSAGLHRFGVNSDDGFRLSLGSGDPRDALGFELGVFDGDRGAGDTTFSFVVPVAGIYPFRLVWWQGTGGASLEWYEFDRDSGERRLINDRSQTSGIRAWQSLRTAPAGYVSHVEPRPNDILAGGDTRLRVEFAAGAGTEPPSIPAESIQLLLDGQPLAFDRTARDSRWIVRQVPGPLLAPGSRHEAEVRWQSSSDPSPRSATWSFQVENYRTLPVSNAVPLSRADRTSPGFVFRVVQGPQEAELPNSTTRAESQLAGTLVHPRNPDLARLQAAVARPLP